MADRILARGEEGAGGWLESACKGILTFRAGILLITVVALWGEDGDRTLPAAAILVAAVTTAIPLRYWDRVGPVLVRHPGYLAGELVLATLILLMTGVNSPFFYYTLGTALLGGLVYGWPGAGLFSVMLIGVYFWVVVGPRRGRAATLVMPALLPADRRRGGGRCAGCSTARPRPSPSSPRSPSARGWRATCTTRWPRPCRAWASRRSRSRATSSATRRRPPPRRGGSPRTRARRRARRARSSSGCAPTRASSCR